MGQFWQVLGGVLVAVVLILMLYQKGKDIALVLSVIMCCTVLLTALFYLRPVVDFVRQLQDMGKLDGDTMRIMLKAVGIGLTGEIAALICADAGNGALGKTVQIMASAVILWLSLPLMQGLMDMIQRIMGEV